MIKGNSSLSLQRLFLADWNFCSEENVLLDKKYFPVSIEPYQNPGYAQLVSHCTNPDLPSSVYAIVQAMNSPHKEKLRATPDHVPDNALQEALVIASLSGVDIKILVPKKGDYTAVSLVTQSFFDTLLRAGVKVYLYEKGFIHSKTIVVDGLMASVGTANLDMRSFDLNFEVSALVYDEKIAQELRASFYKDLEVSIQLDPDRWRKRSNLKRFIERFVRLTSPFM